MSKELPGIQHPSPWMFRYAVGLAICVLVLIVLGASLTSEIQPLPGADVPVVSASTPGAVSLDQAHTLAAWIVSALTLGLAVWLQLGDRRASLRWLGWSAFAVVVVEGWSGMQGVLQSMPRAAGFFHGLFAQCLLSIAVAAAAGAYTGTEPDEMLEDSGRPSLRSLSMVAPHLVLLQVILGATFRHGLMGVLLHILNALVVAMVVLVACMLVMRQFPGRPSLKQPALVLAIVTGIQVMLGFATFTFLLIGSGNGSPALFILSVGHVSTGAVTLAASVLLAIQVRRQLRRQGGDS
jgi:heme A synthase